MLWFFTRFRNLLEQKIYLFPSDYFTWNNISGHFLDLPGGFLVNLENGGPDIGGGRDEHHGVRLVLVPLEKAVALVALSGL